MRLYSGQIPRIAEDVVRALRESEAIEVPLDSVPEAELDVQGVMREYIRTDRDISTRAREMADEGRGSFGRIKRQLAFQSNFKLGDEGLDYVVNQLIETFLHSNHIEEIYADDLDLRLQMSKIIKKHTRDMSEELDHVVRDRIKNLQEGSTAWEDEYERVMGRLKRNRNLE